MKSAGMKINAGAINIVVLAMAVIFLMAFETSAGNLEPSAEPSPTMHTLEEIYAIQTANTAKIDALAAKIDAMFNNSIAHIGTSVRFVDLGDGTVHDTSTNLIWLKNASCFPYSPWTDGMSNVAGLNDGECGLSDGSAEGDWRLPTKEELLGLGYDPTNPSTLWTTPGEPFYRVQNTYYYTGSEESGNVWCVYMPNSLDQLLGKSGNFPVWPVKPVN